MTRRPGRWPVLLMGLALLLSGCGGSSSGAGQITWHEGAAPAASGQPPVMAAVVATETPPAMATDAPLPAPTAAIVVAASGDALTASQRMQAKPNELGVIPILMYHVMTLDKPATNDGYSRSIADFQADLQKLYDLGYYVVSLRDIVTDAIRAPLGKHPVARTFDDGSAGQFRYLIGANGSLTIDPHSAVGIMEAFYAAHPDFGRGGLFRGALNHVL